MSHLKVEPDMSIGVPIKLLHEAEGHIVTIELKTGEMYRGRLDEAEDNMNVQMSEITMTSRDGSKHPLEHAFLRGSQITYLILPDMLRNAPMFRKDLIKAGRAKGLGILGRGGSSGRGRSMLLFACSGVGWGVCG